MSCKWCECTTPIDYEDWDIFQKGTGTILFCPMCGAPLSGAKAPTNFGRITASPEALAGFLNHHTYCDRCSQMDHARNYTEQDCDGHCGSGLLNWLNQPDDESEG